MKSGLQITTIYDYSETIRKPYISPDCICLNCTHLLKVIFAALFHGRKFLFYFGAWVFPLLSFEFWNHNLMPGFVRGSVDGDVQYILSAEQTAAIPAAASGKHWSLHGTWLMKLLCVFPHPSVCRALIGQADAEAIYHFDLPLSQGALLSEVLISEDGPNFQGFPLRIKESLMYAAVTW